MNKITEKSAKPSVTRAAQRTNVHLMPNLLQAPPPRDAQRRSPLSRPNVVSEGGTSTVSADRQAANRSSICGH